jgi:tripartite-type tricarboxylate transporter receptor subunit TctC
MDVPGTHLVAKWQEAIQEMSKDQEFVAKLKGVGFTPFYRSSGEAREHVMKEMEQAAKLWGLK